MKKVIVSASFDDLKSSHIRFLEESSRLGEVYVLLWSDEVVQSMEGKGPKFSEVERNYLLQAIRYVHEVRILNGKFNPDTLPELDVKPDIWVVDEKSDSPAKKKFCKSHGMDYRVLTGKNIAGFPNPQGLDVDTTPGHKKVIVSGCFDWFHSGHVRFFEEVSELGDLYVVVGHDENLRLLKGDGHPLFKQDERRYVAGSIRYVRQSLVSTGHGWLDAEPEIRKIKPDIYAVNEDGDQPEKREYCEKNGIQYVVLKRTPKEGLIKRTSTNLRGF
ncbi:MAG: adenylyltransferase/cytidyltransferase family protein [Kiritimatiellae bacterium]|nr:adenylyltransferase/cytidyltransferase family protein [Kiritimatiellia bacterium]MDD5522517.1 adenylyltransferase/cytidyltransferase family protein [Kiritimatiellia bacterium]